MKPKSLGVWMVIAVLCCMMNSLSAETSGLFTYKDSGKSITITRYPKDSVGAVEIPSTINDKPVTNIGDDAFHGCSDVTSITIPGTVTSIGDGAFWSCAGLTSITIPSDVTSIGVKTFFKCKSLKEITVDSLNAKYSSVDGMLFNKNQTTLIECPGGKSGSVTLPSSVDSIEKFAFDGCARLTSITLPPSITSIELCAFDSCSGLTNITIPAGVTSIGDFAFAHCTSLTSITIPSSVTSIGGLAFYSCTGLTSVTIPAGVTSIGWPFVPFSRCAGLTEINVDSHNANYSSVDGVLFDKKQTTLILYPGGKTGGVTIPAGLTSIDEGAFSQCTGLTAINVDSRNVYYSSVDGVLYNKYVKMLIRCPGGKTGSLAIPPGVISVGRRDAFSDCVGLTSVTIPASVRRLGDSGFGKCAVLKEINVDPLNAKYGSSEGMLYNKDLTTLIRCPSGKSGGVTIPASVINFDKGAFSHCAELKEISVDPHNDDYSSVDGMLFNKDKTTLIQCPGGKAGMVIIPSTVFSIKESAFDSCKDLSGVKIPDSVTSVGSHAFSQCSRLTSVTIPATITHIGQFAFSNCNALTRASFLGNAPEMGQSVFYKTAGDFTVHCRKGKTGFTSPKWEGYKAVIEDESK